MRFIFILDLLRTHCVPVAHLFYSALRGILMIFLVDIFTLELLFCKSTYCTVSDRPLEALKLLLTWQQMKDTLPQGHDSNMLLFHSVFLRLDL